MAQKLKKDGTPDKRFKKNKGKIQEIIDSKQAPGVHIATEHQSAPKDDAEETRRLAIYKERTGGKDPNEPLDWSDNGSCGGQGGQI